MKLKINNNKTISVEELNEVLLKLSVNSYHDKIEILFTNQIDKFDIVFIAGLILLWNEYKTKFSIEYEQSIPDARIFEVRQYLQLYQRIFKVNWKDIFEKFRMISELNDNDFIASESFSPIIYISEDTINTFFCDSTEEKFNYELFILKDKYLNEKIIHHNSKEESYFNSEISIKKRLANHPPIFTFVFSLLYNKISPFVNSRKKGVRYPIDRIEQLWEFTNEYVKGLYELAKNIVEHSSTRQGMITLRVYDDAEKSDKILETYVFDYGAKGIIPKLIEDTSKKIGLNDIYNEDLLILNNDFALKDFIEPTVKSKLNQQLYRDIAHYGLMKFFRLIKRNDGIVVASSLGKRNVRDLFNPTNITSEKTCFIGTSYFFQLPFIHDKFRSIDKPTNTLEFQGSPQIVSSINKMMKLKVVKENEIYNSNDKILKIIEPDIFIRNRKDEESLFKLILSIINEDMKIEYLAINFAKLNINDSSLLRLLAHLSTNYTQSIILFNLKYEIFDEMIENNKQFFFTLKDLKDNIPFWYENKGILIFTLIDDLNFNFADILYGVNEKEMKSINYIINNTFPNTYSNTEQLTINDDYDNFIIPMCLKSYFHQTSLLPFDILLYNENNKLLFQSNIEIILMQEMNMNRTELL